MSFCCFLKFKKDFRTTPLELYGAGSLVEWGFLQNQSHLRAIKEGFAKNVECEVDENGKIIKELGPITDAEMKEYLNKVLLF
jgi:hypothetical protein